MELKLADGGRLVGLRDDGDVQVAVVVVIGPGRAVERAGKIGLRVGENVSAVVTENSSVAKSRIEGKFVGGAEEEIIVIAVAVVIAPFRNAAALELGEWDRQVAEWIDIVIEVQADCMDRSGSDGKNIEIAVVIGISGEDLLCPSRIDDRPDSEGAPIHNICEGDGTVIVGED